MNNAQITELKELKAVVDQTIVQALKVFYQAKENGIKDCTFFNDFDLQQGMHLDSPLILFDGESHDLPCLGYLTGYADGEIILIDHEGQFYHVLPENIIGTDIIYVTLLILNA